jgi:lactose/cellobiose-specific phosphotransferase system IIC component
VGTHSFLAGLQFLSGQRWLRAIRNSLVLLLPVIFVGALALLVGSFPFALLLPPPIAAAAQPLQIPAMMVWQASGGILALCLVVLISHYLAVDAREKQSVEVSPPVAATVAMVNFFIFTQVFLEPEASLWMFGARSTLTAILVAIASSELLFSCLRFQASRVGRQRYVLDPSLHLAVRAIVPALVTVAAFFLLSTLLSLIHFDLGQRLSVALVRLNEVCDSELPGLLAVGVLHQLLWFFGVHGGNVLESVYSMLFYAAGDGHHVFTVSKTLFDLYVHVGGSGSTLGLLLVILLRYRHSDSGRVARYALLPSLFNINELVIFGLPIVFNPVYLVPFLLAPLMQIAVSYLCVRHGLVDLDQLAVPWITPPLLGGTINSASWHGGALQLFNLLLSAAIYAPFVGFAERQKQREGLGHVQRIVAEIEGIRVQSSRVLKRHDDLGHTARKLLREFIQDLGTNRVYLVYQPQHDDQRRVVGVEALMRWQHHHFGLISPSAICLLLEESRQICLLGRWVIATACRQLGDWKRAGIAPLRMSVNLSPLQLKDAGLATFIGECLQSNQLPAGEFGLELTESQHVPDDRESVQTLKALQAMGIHLEMDDFGMGYSSMLYIRRFHFDAIKLDGSLTREVLQSNNCCDIIASVVQLARALKMRVIAEYVETSEQQQLLARLGCDAFQGYWYSPPLAARQCLDYLRQQASAEA